jgi:hypothetical protein
MNSVRAAVPAMNTVAAASVRLRRHRFGRFIACFFKPSDEKLGRWDGETTGPGLRPKLNRDGTDSLATQRMREVVTDPLHDAAGGRNAFLTPDDIYRFRVVLLVRNRFILLFTAAVASFVGRSSRRGYEFLKLKYDGACEAEPSSPLHQQCSIFLIEISEATMSSTHDVANTRR